MNVVTPALNGIDIDINGAAFCTFLPSCSVQAGRQAGRQADRETDPMKLILS
jgi:hypothetical protein